MAAWTTSAEMKTLLAISAAGDDALITILIANAEAHIGMQTGRQFTAANATRYFDPTDPRVVDGPYLFLDEDLVSVTTLTNGDGDVLVTATEYIKLPVNDAPPYHTIKLVDSGGIFWTYDDDPEIAISLLGSWGYQAAVPADIKYACQLLTAFYYRSRQAGPDTERTIMANGVVIAPAMVPKMVDNLIDPYRKLY